MIFGLKKLCQYLYGRRLILVTDHLHAWTWKGHTSAGSQLARWALLLSQFDPKIEYRKMTPKKCRHAYVASYPQCLTQTSTPGKRVDEVELISAIGAINDKLTMVDYGSQARESAKDYGVISVVLLNDGH